MERIEESTFPNNIRNHIKEVVGEKKKYHKIYRDEYLKKEIERYLESTLVQLVLLSGIYNESPETSKSEDFTLDMVESIFNDDNIIFEDENVKITLAHLIKQLNTKYDKIQDFYAPIKEYRKLAVRAEAVYKREYEKNGVAGLKAVYDSFDVLLDDNVNKDNLEKVSTSKSVQKELVNIIILNRRGLPLSKSPEKNEAYFYTQMANSFKEEEKNNQYRKIYA